MNHSKLKKFCKKEKLYTTLMITSVIPVLPIFIMDMLKLIRGDISYIMFGIILGIMLLLIIFTAIFGNRADYYSELADNYILNEIIIALNEKGINTSNCIIYYKGGRNYLIEFKSSIKSKAFVEILIEEELEFFNELTKKKISLEIK